MIIFNQGYDYLTPQAGPNWMVFIQEKKQLKQKLELLPYEEYKGVNRDDPIRFYFYPVIGTLYKRRIELCLEECTGGERILEVGFGTGLSFLNLNLLYKEIFGVDLTADVETVHTIYYSRGIQTFLFNGNVMQMEFPDSYFDTVLLISILEHLKPDDLSRAFSEIRRVLKPGGQVVYGVPVERPFMRMMFRLLGYDIRKHHFSTESDVQKASAELFDLVRIKSLKGIPGFVGSVYQVGHFVKRADTL